jgi:hypothetical protein
VVGDVHPEAEISLAPARSRFETTLERHGLVEASWSPRGANNSPAGAPMTAATLNPEHCNERALGRGVNVGDLRPGAPGDLAVSGANALRGGSCRGLFHGVSRNRGVRPAVRIVHP